MSTSRVCTHHLCGAYVQLKQQDENNSRVDGPQRTLQQTRFFHALGAAAAAVPLIQDGSLGGGRGGVCDRVAGLHGAAGARWKGMNDASRWRWEVQGWGGGVSDARAAV